KLEDRLELEEGETEVVDHLQRSPAVTVGEHPPEEGSDQQCRLDDVLRQAGGVGSVGWNPDRTLECLFLRCVHLEVFALSQPFVKWDGCLCDQDHAGAAPLGVRPGRERDGARPCPVPVRGGPPPPREAGPRRRTGVATPATGAGTSSTGRAASSSPAPG